VLCSSQRSTLRYRDLARLLTRSVLLKWDRLFVQCSASPDPLSTVGGRSL
jgi:hypothetical protein